MALQVLQKSLSAPRIAKEVAAAESLLLAMHPGAGSSNSAAAGMPASPRWLLLLVLTCCGTGSPIGFTLDKDDVSVGMMSPHSGNMLDSGPTFYQSFGEFGQQQPSCMALDSEPWCPFTLEGDYIFATITVEAGLSAVQFSNFEITAPYKGDDVTFQVHVHPLWDWALDLLQNPLLAPHFVWDAQHLFKYNGDCWWDIQAPELAKEERKTGYANFKGVIWHKAFYKLLKKVAELSKVGYLHECYDNVLQWHFPVILILSADYEELAQHKEALAIYEDKKSAGEKKLKSLSLCPVKLQATTQLTWGHGGKHMHKELKIVVNELGCEFKMKLEEQCCQATRSLAGYQLLCMICSYLQLDTLIRLDVQTEKTISMIKNELLVFRDELKDNWNFPKVHLWKHVTYNIQSKGTVHNYSAWPNKKMHGPLKDAYQDHSNGKDVVGQILHVDHHQLAVKLIQACIDTENECADHVTNDDGGIQDEEEVLNGNTKLGAPQQPTSLSSAKTAHRDDRAFNGFCWKLEAFLNTCLPTYWYHLDEWIRLQGTHMVQEYQYLKVKYTSMVDWEVATDHLRCSLKVHGQQWYDCALIQLSETKTAFVQLIFLFTCKVAALDDIFHLALVQPLTAGTGLCRLDQDFDLIRVKAVSCAASIFIPVKSIIRGALLYPDPSHHGEFFIVEHIDGDMFLQMKQWTQTCHQMATTAKYLPSSDSDEMPTKMQSDHSGTDVAIESEQQETELVGSASK
ncbi:hypothetical protein F5141DRAFT_1065743 [Pisolithus sp. B1]|nr:hypothetical protein F5141DRAFT_1065743 [Pisolithus sp. B1]